MLEAENPVATLCHDPQTLAADVLDGYEMTAYRPSAPRWEPWLFWVDGVVRDGNLVTGQAWPDHPELLAGLTDLLNNDIAHGDPVLASDD